MNAQPQASRQLATWQDFQTELKARETEIVSMLPSNVSRAGFINSTIAAVKHNPDILKASPRSLFNAITKSAQDGLRPDGREGVINVYKGEAVWQPMVFGLRKRARETDGLIVNAEPVYANDSFLWRQGDEPAIDHTPAPLGQKRGDLIGAYAIFRAKDGEILHREVMDKNQIEAVRAQSRAPDSLMWSKFTAEAYKKTVVRRGFKTVPASETLERVVTRDDEQFSFQPHEAPAALAPPPPPAAAKARATPPPPPGQGDGATKGDVEEAQVVAEGEGAGGQNDGGDAGGGQGEGKAILPHPGVSSPEKYLAYAKAMFDSAATVDELGEIFNRYMADDLRKLFPPDADELRKLYGGRIKALQHG